MIEVSFVLIDEVGSVFEGLSIFVILLLDLEEALESWVVSNVVEVVLAEELIYVFGFEVNVILNEICSHQYQYLL